jgi:polysaccharide deacetylase 2 family uncharacterized protein YibQ
LRLLNLVTRPWGYLIVGALAALFGLGGGAAIAYFSAGGPDIVEIHADLKVRQIQPLTIEIAIIKPLIEPVVDAPPAISPPAVAALDHVALSMPPEPPEPPRADIVEPVQVLAWERNAVTVRDPAGHPMIAVVIDDLGLDRRNTVRAIRLPGPLTLAFMTYAEQLGRQTSQAHAAGHELLVHFPMEPKDADFDTGPMALTRDLSDDQIRRRVRWGLDRFEGYVGVNNHMGSAFTEDARGMAIVLEEVRKRGLLFLDSITTERSVGKSLAASLGVPFAARHVFLDNVRETTAVEARLLDVERIARSQGYAIAIGHPHNATIDALNAWLPDLAAKGFALVPLSLIVKHRQGS